MKNIHLLSTDKPSRLFKFANNLHLDVIPKDYYKKYQIYITSDEEIKEGDWITDCEFDIMKLVLEEDGDLTNWKKIILTTDPDLIVVGVQSIDDEFLEWFVKNPSCEFVEVYEVNGKLFAEPIIPKEEPKQEKIEEATEIKRSGLYNSIYSIVKQIPRKDVDGDAMDVPSCAYELEQVFHEWQAERMYSDEEVLEILESFNNGLSREEQLNNRAILSHFEQFKKK